MSSGRQGCRLSEIKSEIHVVLRYLPDDLCIFDQLYLTGYVIRVSTCDAVRPVCVINDCDSSCVVHLEGKQRCARLLFSLSANPKQHHKQGNSICCEGRNLARCIRCRTEDGADRPLFAKWPQLDEKVTTVAATQVQHKGKDLHLT